VCLESNKGLANRLRHYVFVGEESKVEKKGDADDNLNGCNFCKGLLCTESMVCRTGREPDVKSSREQLSSSTTESDDPRLDGQEKLVNFSFEHHHRWHDHVSTEASRRSISAMV